MQSNLQTAIYNYITGTNAFKTAIGGRFSFKDLSTTIFPYCVGFVLTQIPERDSVKKYERFRVQFSIYQSREGSEGIYSIANKFSTLFDDCESSLSVTGYKVIRVDRILSQDINLDTLNIDRYDFIYTIQLEKN
jgi:hypothetical protein